MKTIPLPINLTKLEVQYIVGLATQAECFAYVPKEARDVIQHNLLFAIEMGYPVTETMLKNVGLGGFS